MLSSASASTTTTTTTTTTSGSSAGGRRDTVVCKLRRTIVDRALLVDALRCLLHSILFTRSLGLVQPLEECIELLDFHYTRSNDPGVERKIEEKIKLFSTMLIERAAEHERQRSSTSAAGGGSGGGGASTTSASPSASSPSSPSSSPSLVECTIEVEFRTATPGGKVWSNEYVWERWLVPVALTTAPSSSSSSSSSSPSVDRVRLRNELRERVFDVLTAVNEHKNHVPPLTSSAVVPFPYEINVPRAQESSLGTLFHAAVDLVKAPHSLPGLLS